MTGGRGRELIVNADDLGLAEDVNSAIFRAHTAGIVTSASLMVRQPGANHAVDRCREFEDLSVGLHVDLGEWRLEHDTWIAVYEVVELEDKVAADAEIRAQLERFIELVGRPPTHLDSHQHVHLREPVLGIMRRLAARLSVPLRHQSDRVRYCGEFYGQDQRGVSYPEWVSESALTEVLRRLPRGVTELACHPGPASLSGTMYARERAIELRSLCHDDVIRTIEEEGIRLISFADLSDPPPATRRPL